MILGFSQALQTFSLQALAYQTDFHLNTNLLYIIIPKEMLATHSIHSFEHTFYY